MSFKSYRIIDLLLWLAIMLIAEFITCFAANKWFPIDSFAVSLTFPVILIVAMRWGWFSAIHAVVGAVATCVFSQMSGGQAISVVNVAVSLTGNLTLLTAMPMFCLFGKGKMQKGKGFIRDRWYASTLYVVVLYLLLNLGTAVADVIATGNNFLNVTVYYLGLNSISLLFALVIVLIVRRLDGVFEDQRAYLIRMEQAREKEKRKREQEINNI